MTARAYICGHEVEYVDDQWFFVDTGEPTNYMFTDAGEQIESSNRICPRCGRPPTVEGYDACLGRIEGATAACCGHGVGPGYMIRDGRWQPLPDGLRS